MMDLTTYDFTLLSNPAFDPDDTVFVLTTYDFTLLSNAAISDGSAFIVLTIYDFTLLSNWCHTLQQCQKF